MAPKILLVEDSRTYAKLARMLLELCGCTVVEAATAPDGLRMARDTSPDLILMDMHLPGMDGLEGVEALKGDPRTKDIPAIALTADRIESETEREAARQAGFENYVQKPTSEAAFRELVAPFLRTPRGSDRR
jgi:CheY-like chemotaxis protein